MMSEVKKLSFSEFQRVEMRVGKVISVDDFPEARNPSYIITADFGPELGCLKTSAQVTAHKKEELIDRLIIGVCNFPPKQIATHISEFLLIAAPDTDGNYRVLSPFLGDSGADVDLGARIA